MAKNKTYDSPKAYFAANVLEGSVCFKFSGLWLTTSESPAISEVIKAIPATAKKIVFDFSELENFDSALICVLLRLYDYAKANSLEFDYASIPDAPKKLLNLATAVAPKETSSQSGVPAGCQLFYSVGSGIISSFDSIRKTLSFIGEIVIAMFETMALKARFRMSDLMFQIQKAGPNALPIVGLISFLVGLILAFVGSVQLAKYGSQIFIADLVGLAMAREMAPMMVAIVMAGRTGAAYAAELGSMRVNEEISAYETFGISPLEFLVLPRMFALMAMFPLLTILADLIGILGGFIIGWGMFDINYEVYMTRTAEALSLTQCFIGVGKSAIFGVIVALIGCMKGMNCGSSSEAVGQSTTSSVVLSITSIIVADSLFAVIFTVFDI